MVAPVGLWKIWGWHPVLGREWADAGLRFHLRAPVLVRDRIYRADWAEQSV